MPARRVRREARRRATSRRPAQYSRQYPTNFADADRALPGLPEGPPVRRPVHQRGDRGEGPHPPRVGHLHLPPGLRPPGRPPRRRGRGGPPAPRVPARPPRRPLRRDARPTSSGGTRSRSPATTASSSAGARSTVGRQVPGRRRPRPRRRRRGRAASSYGPSPVVRNTHRPIWDYTFPRPIRWKLGDPVIIRIIDYDWSDQRGLTPQQPQGRPPGHAAALRRASSRRRGGGRRWSSPPTSPCRH